MSVDDHGLETIRKSGEEVTTGDKSDYYIKTKIVGNDNSEVDLEVDDENYLKTTLDDDEKKRTIVQNLLLKDILKEIKELNFYLKYKLGD